MKNKIQHIENRLMEIRHHKVLIDCDVAALYGVETKEVNQAVKNNPDKFPKGYILGLNEREKNELVENFDHLQPLKFAKTNPKAFTEKGLYMLATILKSKQATQTTFLIIETFAKLCALQQAVAELSSTELAEGRKRNSLLKNWRTHGRPFRSRPRRNGIGDHGGTQFCRAKTKTYHKTEKGKEVVNYEFFNYEPVCRIWRRLMTGGNNYEWI